MARFISRLAQPYINHTLCVVYVLRPFPGASRKLQENSVYGQRAARAKLRVCLAAAWYPWCVRETLGIELTHRFFPVKEGQKERRENTERETDRDSDLVKAGHKSRRGGI